MSSQSLFRFLLIVVTLFPLAPSTSAREHPSDCSGYDAWIWAQAVFKSDPDRYSALDPDGNGIACENLSVAGFAPVIWADGIPEGVTPVKLVSITDGDTIRVQLPNGDVEPVRLLHIDTPEIGGTIGQCGGTEATDYLTWILSYAKDNTIYLEQDITERDRYDRLLAYVWFEVDGDPNPYMANDALVLSGWAQSETYKPDVKYKTELDAAEKFSVDHVTGARLLCGKFGRPANDAGPSNEQIQLAWQKQPNQGQLPAYPSAPQQDAQPVDVPAEPVNVPEQPVAEQSGDCDPSYPTVCIPPKWQVGDLDCKDIPHRRFTVLPPDPHNFDGDFDGIGCESG